MGIFVALAGGVLVYWLLKQMVRIRLSDEEAHQGEDLSIHKFGANPSA